jgi:TMEM175 potassium channel family protein
LPLPLHKLLLSSVIATAPLPPLVVLRGSGLVKRTLLGEKVFLVLVHDFSIAPLWPEIPGPNCRRDVPWYGTAQKRPRIVATRRTARTPPAEALDIRTQFDAIGDSVCDAHAVTKGRLEAFTDAVIAIVMTIMVLDLRAPGGHGFGDLRPLLPKLLVYALSFTFLAIYWNNHHHLLHVVERVDGRVLWANMGLLFSLSLTPAATAWFGEHPGDSAPVVVYGLVLLLSAIAYFLLTRALLALHPVSSPLAAAIGGDRKGLFSAIAYMVAIVLAVFEPWAAIAIYVAVAVVWLVPDRRIARIVERGNSADP